MASPRSATTADGILRWLRATQPEAVTHAEKNPKGTILAPPTTRAEAVERALGMLQKPGRPYERYAPGPLIGKGGMGRVFAAEERLLGREVALKALNARFGGTHAIKKLLQEAWVTGSLEHPGVVPIHDVVLGADGRPAIVMKRIQGAPGGKLLHDREARFKHLGEEVDALDWNLGVLLQVCQAVRYAHDRGIVHRDLKPDNVMVGRYGEVHVVDWGLAVALEDDGTGRFPLASDAVAMAGTPCYMAPEMLGGEESRIGKATDVYLLGALLHEIVLGQAPHAGDGILAMVTSIMQPERPLPDDLPEEVRQLLSKALAFAPEQRFEDGGAFRRALEELLRHQGSRRLAERAAVRAATLAARTAAPDVDSGEVQELWSEAAFGYRAALEAWPGNAEARAGLRDAADVVARFELGRDDPAAALRVLASIDEPPDARVREAEDALAASEARRDDLERLGRDHDPRIGIRARAGVSALIVGIWTLVPLQLYLSGATGTFGRMRTGAAVLLATLAGASLLAGPVLSSTFFNRAFVQALAGVVTVQLLLALAAESLGLDPTQAQVVMLGLYASATAVGSATFDRRLTLAAVGYALAFVAGALWPAEVYLWITLGNATLLVTLLVANGALERRRPRRKRPPPPGDP
ncbi:MAG: serine/threonine-protein kinase [Myxococcota bacterium]